MGLPDIDPPLLNSANPWCSTKEDLQALYDCPHTGGITTRTSLINGFNHDPSIHKHTFFDPHSHQSIDKGIPDYTIAATHSSSLNTLGYSPHPLSSYLSFITALTPPAHASTSPKPIIISVTGDPSSILQCYDLITTHRATLPPTKPLAMEINLSCPNIPSAPPPAYSGVSLLTFLTALQHHPSFTSADRVPVGIKTPPYTYHDQFATLVSALRTAAERLPGVVPPVDFVTATNTLGSCLLLSESGEAVLRPDEGDGGAAAASPRAGIGGMAGAALHPLSLGNVRTIRALLDAEGDTRLAGIDVIGVGGVEDRAGFARMRAAGAKVVGVGTALGREGVGVFGRILGKG